MVPEVSFLCSREPATGPYSDPNESIPCFSSLFCYYPFLILSLHQRPGLPSDRFPLGFPIIFMRIFFFLCMRQEGEKYTHVNLEGLKRRAHLGIPGVEDRTALKWILKKKRVTVCLDSAILRQGKVAPCYEHVNISLIL
jgi:hypothetical protein